jgi:peptidoglycan pentaglycine glycine transferase (the first glycine)
MEFSFKYELEPADRREFVDFYNKAAAGAIEQNADWIYTTGNAGSYCYFRAVENANTVCTAIIYERKSRGVFYAEILFGPVFLEEDAAIESLKEIEGYYRKKGITVLTVQLGVPSSQRTEYIEHRLNKSLKPLYRFDRNNWTSIGIDLAKTEEEIFKQFSKGHKSDIKKAEKANLIVTDEFTDDEFEQFVSVFLRMNAERGIKVDSSATRVYLEKVKCYFKESGAGKFLLVKDSEGVVAGGIAIVHQHETARYFKGAADPSKRQMPILHLAIREAIVKSKRNGFRLFDMWGYNHFVDEKDQVFFINRFKKGFGGEFIFYPKKMYFIFSPLRFRITETGKRIYKKLLKRG